MLIVFLIKKIRLRVVNNTPPSNPPPQRIKIIICVGWLGPDSNCFFYSLISPTKVRTRIVFNILTSTARCTWYGNTLTFSRAEKKCFIGSMVRWKNLDFYHRTSFITRMCSSTESSLTAIFYNIINFTSPIWFIRVQSFCSCILFLFSVCFRF